MLVDYSSQAKELEILVRRNKLSNEDMNHAK